jgi:hypothetical protein
MNFDPQRATEPQQHRLKLRAWLVTLCLFASGTTWWGCAKPPATEPVAALPAADSSDSRAEQVATTVTVDPAAPPAWLPDEELVKKLALEQADLGGYDIRVPQGFEEAERMADEANPDQPYLVAFKSPTVEGATPAIISVTIHPSGQEFPERDAMLAAYFANIAAQLPDSQRHATEQGAVHGLPASRAFYEARLPNDLTIKGAVYFIDHGTRRIVLQAAANSGAPDYPIELIDAALQTFGVRTEANDEQR